MFLSAGSWMEKKREGNKKEKMIDRPNEEGGRRGELRRRRRRKGGERSEGRKVPFLVERKRRQDCVSDKP